MSELDLLPCFPLDWCWRNHTVIVLFLLSLHTCQPCSHSMAVAIFGLLGGEWCRYARLPSLYFRIGDYGVKYSTLCVVCITLNCHILTTNLVNSCNQRCSDTVDLLVKGTVECSVDVCVNCLAACEHHSKSRTSTCRGEPNDLFSVKTQIAGMLKNSQYQHKLYSKGI